MVGLCPIIQRARPRLLHLHYTMKARLTQGFRNTGQISQILISYFKNYGNNFNATVRIEILLYWLRKS
jgi:hypothetical protein